MVKPGNGASRSAETEDTAMDTSAAATAGAQGQGGTAGRRSSRKKRRVEEVEEDEEEVEQQQQQRKPTGARRKARSDGTPLKKARLGSSPEPIDGKAKPEKKNNGDEEEMSSEENGDSDMEDAEETKEAEAGKDEGQSPVAAASANSNNGNAKPKAAASKPPLPNLRVPSHQTPGKFARETHTRPASNKSSGEMDAPTRQLMFGNTPTASTAASASNAASFSNNTQAQAPQQFEGGSNDPFNGYANAGGTGIAPPRQAQARNDPFTSTFAWLGILFIFTLSYGFLVQNSMLPPSVPSLSVIGVADTFLDKYKRLYYQHYPPPTREVINQTRVQEIKEMEQERQSHQKQKRKLLKDLEEVQKAMEREIGAMEKNAVDMNKTVKGIEGRVKNHSEPVLKVHERISRIDQLLKNKTSDDFNETVKALTEIKSALGEADSRKVLDLSSLDLWEIPEMPEECLVEEEPEEDEDDDDDDEDPDELASAEDEDGMEVAVSIIDEDRLEEWSNDIQDLIDNSTEAILKDEDVADQIRQWIRSEIKSETKWDDVIKNFNATHLKAQIAKKEKTKEGGRLKGGGSLGAEAILSQIEERLELEIADQTGQFDFASIRNGAVVIREGPRATSKSLVQHLPYFNRMMAHIGLRFYGYGAEAALIPTDPPDALGQCWAFIGEEATKKKRNSKSAQDFSRGSVATLTVRLARPVFVHSVIVEHPPREITDRMDSAIRAFRVVGYEDESGSKGSYELGRFEYKPDGNGPMAEFTVPRKLSRQDVPKLRSIVLAIESTWGGSHDYGCLYRFRVHGDDNE